VNIFGLFESIFPLVVLSVVTRFGSLLVRRWLDKERKSRDAHFFSHTKVRKAEPLPGKWDWRWAPRGGDDGRGGVAAAHFPSHTLFFFLSFFLSSYTARLSFYFFIFIFFTHMAQWEIQRDSQRLKHCVCVVLCLCLCGLLPRAPTTTEFPVPSNLITITSIILAFFFFFFKTVDHFRFIFATRKKKGGVFCPIFLFVESFWKKKISFQIKGQLLPAVPGTIFFSFFSSHRRLFLKKLEREKSEASRVGMDVVFFHTHTHESVHTKAPGVPWCSNQHLLTRGQVGGTWWGCNLFFSLFFFAPSYTLEIWWIIITIIISARGGGGGEREDVCCCSRHESCERECLNDFSSQTIKWIVIDIFAERQKKKEKKDHPTSCYLYTVYACVWLMFL